ncbi:MAG: diguanylate cyclase [Eubacteriales bacterium]|nr:diguanylate cyclase [Eubacteriales bacterium]
MRERFDRHLIDKNRVGIAYQKLLFDQDGVVFDFEYMYMNEAFEKITGLSSAFCIGKKGSECLGGREENFFLLDLFREVEKSRVQREYEFYSESAQRYYNTLIDSPEEKYCILSIRDITDSVNRHVCDLDDLRKSEKSKSMLLSNLPGMAYRCKYDEQWTMLFVSEGSQEVTGYRPEDLINNSTLSYAEIIHPEDRRPLIERWDRVISGHEMFNGEYRIKTASGQVRWVYEQGQALYDAEGEAEAIEGLIIDISKQKMREERIEYLLKHDPLTGLYNRIQYEREKRRFDSSEYYPLSIVVGDINGLKLVNEAFGSQEGDASIIAIAKILKNCVKPSDFLARIGGDEFGILMPCTDAVQANEFAKKVQRLCDEYNQNKETVNVNVSVGYATVENEEDGISAKEKLAEDYLYRHKLLERDSTCSAIISSIKTTMFERSHETKEHAERMATLSREVGSRLALSQLELDDLALLATLHDVGKVVIDNGILMKPGDLSDLEWIQMKKHPEIGYRIASASSEMASIANGILSHHERWDGEGYPRGLKGKEIPLLARIIAVVDAYDAMTEERVYRSAMSEELALEELRNNAGNQFDPEVVKAFSVFMQKKLRQEDKNMK